MFSMNLILKEKRDGSLNLVLPLWFRGIFLFIAILLSAGFITSSGSSNQWIPIILILGSLIGSLYEERWIFTEPRKIIEYRTGLLILNKKRFLNSEDLEGFVISGTFHLENENVVDKIRKTMIKFSLILKSGEVIDIEIVKGKSASEELRIKAETIAEYCGVQLTVSSEQ